MQGIITEGKATYAFVERQFILLKRYWLWEFVWIVYSMCITLAMGFLAKGMPDLAGKPMDVQKPTIFLLVGSLLWGYLAGLFWDISNVVSWERWEGTIEYTFMAPISRVTHILGMCLFSVIYGVVRTAIMLTLVTLVFHLDLSNANIPGALLILGASSFSFLGLGTLVAILPLMSPEKGAQITGIIESVLLMVSGVYYRVDVLPGWMQVLSRFSPATYTLQGMRDALLDGVSTAQLMPCVLRLLLMGAVMVPLGLKVFAWSEQYCKRTGKLKRSG
ncbi:MAG: ABC transporter permease [Armatimonadota bacterium]